MLLIASNMKDDSHVLVMGDFNLPLMKWSSWTCSNNSENSFHNTFINCLRYSFFDQHVTIPTRSWYSQNPSIQDLIHAKEEDTMSSLSHLSPLEKSYHSIFTFNLHCYVKHRRHNRIQYYYKKRLLYHESSIEPWLQLHSKQQLRRWSMIDIQQSCQFYTGQLCPY